MLVDINDLKARLAFTMNADEEREANGALEDLSFDAQAIGSALWTSQDNTPQAVQNLILRAAARHMKNYEGYTASRAGDEQVAWAEQETPGQATFSEREEQLLRSMGGNRKFVGGVGIYAYGNRPASTVGYAPVVNGSPIPYWADGSPW